MQNRLLDLVVCPICYTKLSVNRCETELICSFDNIIFPINNGIPVLLQKESKSLQLLSNKI